MKRGGKAWRFRQRLLSGERLIGTFLKTPTSHATEIFGALGFDFVVIDQEHGPFDRASTEMALLAAEAADVAALVRVSGIEAILSVLDGGAAGVLVPHVANIDRARAVADACRYGAGKRGFAASTRAGGYGAVPMWQHIDDSDNHVVAIPQIEDPEALGEIDAIARVEGLDALFIGRADLSAAFGDRSAEPKDVSDAVDRISEAAKAAGKPIAVFVGGRAEALDLHRRGASLFVVSSDHGFMRAAGSQALAEIRDLR